MLEGSKYLSQLGGVGHGCRRQNGQSANVVTRGWFIDEDLVGVQVYISDAKALQLVARPLCCLLVSNRACQAQAGQTQTHALLLSAHRWVEQYNQLIFLPARCAPSV